MSKKSYFQRTKSIVKRLNTKPYSSFEEINAYIQKEFEYANDFDDAVFTFSKRTFQRDLKEIYEVWGIQIGFSKKNKGYYIVKDAVYTDSSQRLFEVYEMMTALQIAEDLSDIVHFEDRKPLNIHYFDDVIVAIKKRVFLNIQYRKFGAELVTTAKIAPYGLKEYKHRWYIIAKVDEKVRIYALDRIVEIEKLSEKFIWDKSIDINSLYENSFGIYIQSEKEPELIEIQAQTRIAPYIKSLPLHHSQKVLLERITYTTFQLTLVITEELVSELLSFGKDIKVLKPQSLRKTIIHHLKSNLENYSS
jgi:proteasome accessory factor B